jgi:uncharacterized SAM-binding protein YcdF (DUF218 family)
MDNSGFALTILNRVTRNAVAFLVNLKGRRSKRQRKCGGPDSRTVVETVWFSAMFFWLKKLIGYWIQPVSAILALLVVGILLLRSKNPRRARLGRVLLVIATIAFGLLSNKLVSTALLRPLETKYAAIPDYADHAAIPAKLRDCRYVVVLGAGNANTPGLAALDELSTSARARITSAVRVLQLLPDARLIVSGPAEPGYPTHATVLERTALSFGIDPHRIQRIEHARDTEEESLAVKQSVGSGSVVVVTSAWHMPRAIALFRSAGLDPIPCPTDYASQWDRFHWRDLMWDFESLERSTCAIRERAGYIWISLRGKAK